MGDDGYSFGDFSSQLDSGGMFGSTDFSPRLNFDAGSAASSSGGFSVSDLMGKIGGGFSDFGKFASSLLPMLGLGTAGLNLATGIRGAGQLADQTKLATRAANRQDQVSAEAQKVAQPLADFSRSTLADVQAGKIPGAYQAQIDQWKQAARQQVLDFAARTGQAESSQVQSWLAWIEQQAQGMAASVLQQLTGSGIQAGSAAGGVLGTSASASAQAGASAQGQGQSIENLIGQANAAMAKLSAGAA